MDYTVNYNNDYNRWNGKATELLDKFNLTIDEKTSLKQYLGETVARFALELLDLDPHWEDLGGHKPLGKADDLFLELNDYTISWHLGTEEIVLLDLAVLNQL